MTRPLLTIWLLAALAWLPLSAAAQANGLLSHDSAFRVEAVHDEFGGLRFDWEIEPGYYIYRDRIAASRAGEPIPVETQPGTPKDDLNFGQVEIYYGTASALLMEPGEGPLLLTYQGCRENSICYPPVTLVANPGTLSLSPVPAGRRHSEGEGSAAFMLAEDGGMVDSLVEEGGPAWALASFFAFGLLLSFTPCVFPMYPIVAGILAREAATLTAFRGFSLTAAYSVSLAAAFGLAGAVAGWTGSNFHMALQSPYAAGAAALAFLFLALASFGLFDLSLPSAWTSRISRAGPRKGGGVRSAAALGFSSSLVVGPCVTAPLAGALVYVMQTGDAALGAAALFSLGLGKSMPLVALGTIGGGALPKAGAWMESVKKAFGIGFLAAAAWMAWPLVAPASQVTTLEWNRAASVRTVATELKAARDKTPVLVYFTADWCVECANVERFVLSDGEVQSALSSFRLVKADMSDYGQDAEDLMREMKVAGPPTMVFFDTESKEVPGTRIVGGITARAMAEAAERSGLPH